MSEGTENPSLFVYTRDARGVWSFTVGRLRAADRRAGAAGVRRRLVGAGREPRGEPRGRLAAGDRPDGRRLWGGRYQVSWRLQNGDGLILNQLDTQPGYGFQPTDGWATAAPVNDWLALRLPEELSGPPPYPLVMLLYPYQR